MGGWAVPRSWVSNVTRWREQGVFGEGEAQLLSVAGAPEPGEERICRKGRPAFPSLARPLGSWVLVFLCHFPPHSSHRSCPCQGLVLGGQAERLRQPLSSGSTWLASLQEPAALSRHPLLASSACLLTPALVPGLHSSRELLCEVSGAILQVPVSPPGRGGMAPVTAFLDSTLRPEKPLVRNETAFAVWLHGTSGRLAPCRCPPGGLEGSPSNPQAVGSL